MSHYNTNGNTFHLQTPTISPAPTTSSPTPECMNTPEWIDYNGFRCDYYEVVDMPGCPYFGTNDGYDVNTGEPVAGGSTANDNCCYCKTTAVSEKKWAMNSPAINDTRESCYSPHVIIFPQAPTPSPTPTTGVPTIWSTCADTPGWVDVTGDGCDWYETYELPGCPNNGDFAGYDPSTGEPLVGGSVANDNCCHCFGTAVRDMPRFLAVC